MGKDKVEVQQVETTETVETAEVEQTEATEQVETTETVDEVEQVQTQAEGVVKMIRSASEYPEPHEADVAASEVEHWKGYGWTEA